MKITVVYGQNHKGSTYHVARMLAEKLDGEITEIFLPRDFDKFCVGCANCIMRDAKYCPHAEALQPLTQKLDEADVLILASPVYVYHVTGSMKAFLDHYGWRWMVHRPERSMFRKQAVCITTAAGAGMKSTLKDMADSLWFWGVGKVYRYGLPVYAINYSHMSEKKKQEVDQKTTALAKKIKAREGKVQPSLKTKAFFTMMHLVRSKKPSDDADGTYWKQQGWTGSKRPWKD